MITAQTNVIKRYLDEVHTLLVRKRCTNISNDRFLEIYQKYKNGCDKSREILILSQLKLVFKYAYAFHLNSNGSSLDIDDIVGFSNEILLNILGDYQPYKGKTPQQIKAKKYNSFPSFVRNWLEMNLHKVIKDYGNMIRVPHNRIIEVTSFKKYHALFEQKGHSNTEGYFMVINEGKYIKKIVNHPLTNKIKVYYADGLGGWEYKVSLCGSTYDGKHISGEEKASSDSDVTIFEELEDNETSKQEEEKKRLHKKLLDFFRRDLTKRQNEIVDLYFLREEDLKRIPQIITPNYKNKHEINWLNKTSLNTINIYVKDQQGQEHNLSYEVHCNYHTIEMQDTIIRDNYIKPVNQRFSFIKTKSELGCYKFNLKDAEEIKVTQTVRGKTKKIKHKYENNVLSFKVFYSVGQIFTTQTLLNKKEAILKELRKKSLKNEKLKYLLA